MQCQSSRRLFSSTLDLQHHRDHHVADTTRQAAFAYSTSAFTVYVLISHIAPELGHTNEIKERRGKDYVGMRLTVHSWKHCFWHGVCGMVGGLTESLLFGNSWVSEGQRQRAMWSFLSHLLKDTRLLVSCCCGSSVGIGVVALGWVSTRPRLRSHTSFSPSWQDDGIRLMAFGFLTFAICVLI